MTSFHHPTRSKSDDSHRAAVTSELAVHREENEGLTHRLGDQQAIEGVAMVIEGRQDRGREDVGVPDRQPRKAHGFDLFGEIGQVDADLALTSLDRELPQRHAADEDFVRGFHHAAHFLCNAWVAGLPPEGEMRVEQQLHRPTPGLPVSPSGS